MKLAGNHLNKRRASIAHTYSSHVLPRGLHRPPNKQEDCLYSMQYTLRTHGVRHGAVSTVKYFFNSNNGNPIVFLSYQDVTPHLILSLTALPPGVFIPL